MKATNYFFVENRGWYNSFHPINRVPNPFKHIKGGAPESDNEAIQLAIKRHNVDFNLPGAVLVKVTDTTEIIAGGGVDLNRVDYVNYYDNGGRNFIGLVAPDECPELTHYKSYKDAQRSQNYHDYD